MARKIKEVIKNDPILTMNNIKVLFEEDYKNQIIAAFNRGRVSSVSGMHMTANEYYDRYCK